jgi:hypothetical protein
MAETDELARAIKNTLMADNDHYRRAPKDTRLL